MRFQGPYGVYHSAYDTHDWVARFADPGFLRHAALTRIWAVLVLRLANADLLPLDAVRYAARVGTFLDEVTRRGGGVRLEQASAALSVFDAAARAHAAAAREALTRSDEPALDAANRALMRLEPSFIDSAGLRGRPWYRHLIYAPAFTYRPEMLPGISEAIEAGIPARLAEEERRLATAFGRAAKELAPSDDESSP
jgi:N-acetylated-alpha-linked acidic dipeptidase